MATLERQCSCGLRIFRDDAARMIAHEAPECEDFKALLDLVPPDVTEAVRVPAESPDPIGALLLVMMARRRAGRPR